MSAGRWGRVVIALLLLVPPAVVLQQGHRPADDAYISFRHVRNVLEHGAPTWNTTDRPVFGTTSAGLVLALSAATAVSGLPVPEASLWLNTVLVWIIALLVYVALKDLAGNAWVAVVGSCAIGLDSAYIHVAGQGFENPLLIVSILSSISLVRHGRVIPAIVVASAAPLIRAEGVIVFAIVVIDVLARRVATRRAVLAALLIPGAWGLFAWVYYGSPIPQPIIAKQYFPMIYIPFADQRTDFLDNALALPSKLALFVRFVAAPNLVSGAPSGPWDALAFTRLALIAVGLFGAVRLTMTRRRVAAHYFAYAPIFALLYSWIGRVEPWYVPSFAVFARLLVWAGLGVVAVQLFECAALRTRLSPRLRGGLGVVGLCAVGAIFLGTSRYTLATKPDERPRLMASDPRGSYWDRAEVTRYNSYRRAAELLNEDEREHVSAMISEVGFFGYFFRGEVIDTVGLCSPEALDYYPLPRSDYVMPDGSIYPFNNNLTPTKMVLELRPDYVVNSPSYLMNLVRPGSDFLKRYELFNDLRPRDGIRVVVFARRGPR